MHFPLVFTSHLLDGTLLHCRPDFPLDVNQATTCYADLRLYQKKAKVSLCQGVFMRYDFQNFLIEKIKSLPDSSGVYQFFDLNNKILYIGKAKNLKNRVKSYFRFTPTLTPNLNLSNRVLKMISESVNLEYILTENEQDALILENSLIKQLKPKYNILLRDDKTYPYIFLDLNEDYPVFEITRKVINNRKNIRYFGPFTSGGRELLEAIYEIFKLKQKKSCKKKCLFYQIDKCLAPCEELISKDDYRKIVDNAVKTLQNRDELIKSLSNKMMKFSEQLRFEEAGELRDKIKLIKSTSIKSNIDLAKLDNFDIFLIKESSKRAVLVKLFIRNGKLISSNHSFLRVDEKFDIQEAYSRAIIDFYSKDLPVISKRILTPIELEERDSLEEFLNRKFNKKITINSPIKGDKKRLIELALLNARELLKVDKDETILDEIKESFRLQNYPNRVEIFDNSHISQTINVGGMVVYENNRFNKSEYKKYNLEAKNEYSQMQELLTKRALIFDKNSPPELWVIDGGKTLLNLAKKIIDSTGANVDVISISKERIDEKVARRKSSASDKIHTIFGEIKFNKFDKKLQFIQKLRDEAHRFAISFHRQKKLKEDKKLGLLEVKGIGKAKIVKLINYFGTFENIKNASFEELKSLLNEKDAKAIIEMNLKNIV